MKPRPLPSQAELLALFRYDPETGALYWRERSVDQFRDGGNTAAGECRRWNGRYAGKPALNSTGGSDYLHGKLNGQPLLAHRVIWKMVTGEEPPQIDHEDGDNYNNRWRNLSASDAVKNMKNKRRYKSNKSGCTGVNWHKQHGKWCVSIGSGPTYEFLGLFDDLEKAIRVRRSAERKAGYHPNHDRIAK